MGTIIVLAVVCIMIYFAVRSIIRDRKAGRCSGGCAGCGRSCGRSCQQDSSAAGTSENECVNTLDETDISLYRL